MEVGALSPLDALQVTAAAKQTAWKTAVGKAANGEMLGYVQVTCPVVNLPNNMSVGPMSFKIHSILVSEGGTFTGALCE